MSMCTLFNVPSNINEMNVFSFNNQAEHTKIASAIFSQYNITVPVYPLDPIPLNDMGAWLIQHQNLHNIMNSVLGTNSNDLTDVNFKDSQQLAGWIWLHAQEHYVASNTLELT
jgi:hypothetical protein